MKITYEVLMVISSQNLTMRLTTHDNQKEAEHEANRLHSTDRGSYKVIKVIKECVHTITGK